MRGLDRLRLGRGMPSRTVRLMVAGVLVVAGGVGIVAASVDSSDDEVASESASIGTAVTEPAPADDAPADDAPADDAPAEDAAPAEDDTSANDVYSGDTDSTDSDDSDSDSSDDSSSSEQPAPAGSSPGVWWRPGADNVSPSLLWVFNPSTNSGYQKEYQPTGIDGPFQYQHTFTYDSTDSGVRLTFLSVTSVNPHDEDLTSLTYDSSDGVLRVDRDGSTESWFGCSSGEMPALAAVLC